MTFSAVSDGDCDEAREILGASAANLSQEEIRQILRALNLLAAELLDMQERGEI